MNFHTNLARRVIAATLAVIFTIPASAAEAAKNWSLDNLTSLRFSQVTGPGRGTSFYKNGTFVNHEPELGLRRDWGQGWKSKIESRLRFTNDELSDQRDFSVETLSAEVKNGNNIISGGDYFAVASQYSMNQLIKGIAWERKLPGKDDYFRVMAGSFDNQWEQVFTLTPNEPVDRFGGGARLQRSGDKWRWGLNYAVVDDDETDPNRLRAAVYDQHISALDWEYRWKKTSLRAEHAAAFTQKEDVVLEKTNDRGHANRLRLTTTLWKTRIRASAENVSSQFLSLAGSATKDRRRYNVRTSRRFGRKWSANSSFNLSHNDLAGSSAKTRTTNTTYDIGLTRKKIYGRRNLQVGGTVRRKQTDTHDNSRERTTDRFRLKVSDRLTRKIRGSFVIEPTLDLDRNRNIQQETFLYELRVSSRHKLWKKWTLRSQLGGRRREVENLTTMGDDIAYGINMRTSLSAPGGTRMGVDFNFNRMDLFNGRDSRTSRSRLFYEVKPKWMKGGDLIADYSMNHYAYTNARGEYVENLVKLTGRWKL